LARANVAVSHSDHRGPFDGLVERILGNSSVNTVLAQN
jgi:hypothetical protein